MSFAQATSAAVILGQEHHLRAEDIADAGRTARRLGWYTVWAAATPGPSGRGTSGGVVIMVKEGPGISVVPSAWNPEVSEDTLRGGW